MTESHFADALREASPQYALLIACRQLREWLDLPDADRARRIRSVLTDDRAARSLAQAKSLVWGRLAREFAAPSDDWMGALGALDARTASGASTVVDQEYVRRVLTLLSINALVLESYPGAASSTTASPQLDEIVAGVPALEEAIHGCDVSAATSASIAKLQTAIRVFTHLADDWTLPIHTDHAWWLGMASYTLGRAALEVGDPTLAREAFEQGVAEYERAGEWGHADDLRVRVQAIDRGRRGDVDATVQASLRALLSPQDAMRRYASLASLAAASNQAGDQYEYARTAELLAVELLGAGLADPELDALGAMRSWVNTAVVWQQQREVSRSELHQNDVLKRVNEIAGFWTIVMGARATDRDDAGTLRDPARASRAEQSLPAIGEAIAVMLEDAELVSAAIGAELSEWFPPNPVQPSPGQSELGGAAHSPGGGAAGYERSSAAQRAADGAAISSALYSLRLACNESANETQLAQVTELVERTRTLGLRIHEVQARLEQAYVLLALERYADVSASTQGALGVLSPARNASLNTFTLAHERELYLTARQFEARALAGLRLHDALLSVCQSVIAEIEEQREHVSAPYQQSAFLATRAEFYEYCAAAAHKLGRYDLLLETTERLKASSAWKFGRIALDDLPMELVTELAALDAQYSEVNRALADVTARGVVREELLERRRRIATARAIASGTARNAAPPVATIAAVQGALADDEAALSWFWLSDDILLVLAFTRDRFHTEPIVLSSDARSLFERWIVSVGATAAGEHGTIAMELDRVVDGLAPTLFPEVICEFVQGKTRLILSPHRTLHLFPFHAMRLQNRALRPWLIEQAAIRYAANLTSLLLPWSGNSTGPVLAVGINDFGASGFPHLENAVLEAEQVAAAHGTLGRVAPALTRTDFTSLPLSTYRCLHLATHGTSVLTGDAHNDPLSCGIAFADGLLDGWQLAALDVRAELVVLASCYSGQRAIGGRGLAKLPGDDVLGLQTVLFEAGAGTLLGALWPVDDENTRTILVDFHRNYAAGEEPDRALQMALVTYLDNPFRRHDRYWWAPFFLTAVRNCRTTRHFSRRERFKPLGPGENSRA